MAKDIKRHITHLKSKVVENNAPKLISGSDIYEGEIAVNYAKGYETLSIKNESGETVTFLPRPYNSARGGETIHPIFNGTGTAGGTNLSAAWSGNCDDIKTLYDGLTILYKVNTAGHSSGDILSINGGEAHKVLINASTQLTTHYPVGSIIKLTYDSSQSASFYTGSTEQKTTTGVWKIENYDSNTDNVGYYVGFNQPIYKTDATTYRYMLLLTKNESTLTPLNTESNITATTKTLTTSEFDPFGDIIYKSSTTQINANGIIPSGTTWTQYALNLAYSFNTGSGLTANKAVYMVATPQSNGKAKLHTSPISQTLPTTDDGLIYIYLGISYSTTNIFLTVSHPIYQFKNGQLRQYVGSFGNAAYLNTGTTAGTVAAGNHNHSGTYATNAFSRIAVNTTNIDADSTGDTFTITAGTFVSLTGDATNDKMTIGVSTGTTSNTVARGDHNHDTVYVKKSDVITSITPSNSASTNPVSTSVVAENELEISNALNALSSSKADKATTLAGYGITDAYTKSQTYTKTEVNGLVDTPHQNYVTVATYADLPATGSADTIYRVSNWDGSANGGAGAVDVTVYSEYAWDDVSNPNKYVFLCVKSQIGEVFDISVYNNNAKYDTLADALGTNGEHVPQSIRRGGMSVKYVQNSDNRYMHCLLNYPQWTLDTKYWLNIEDTLAQIESNINITIDTDTFVTGVWQGEGQNIIPNSSGSFSGNSRNDKPYKVLGKNNAVLTLYNERHQRLKINDFGMIIKFTDEDGNAVSYSWNDSGWGITLSGDARYMYIHISTSNLSKINHTYFLGFGGLNENIGKMLDDIKQNSDKINNLKAAVDYDEKILYGGTSDFLMGYVCGIYPNYAYVGNSLDNNPMNHSGSSAFGKIDVSNVEDGTNIYLLRDGVNLFTGVIFKFFGTDGNIISASNGGSYATNDRGKQKPTGAVVLGIHIQNEYITGDITEYLSSIVINMPVTFNSLKEQVSENTSDIDTLKSQEDYRAIPKILMIGSSFSYDTINEVGNICSSYGKKIVLGSAEIGGGTLGNFIDRYNSHTGIAYHKWNKNATQWVDYGDIYLENILSDEAWDFVILQNGAYQSPHIDQSSFWIKTDGVITRNIVQELIDLCKKLCLYSNPVFGMNMTWAFSVYHTIASNHLNDDYWESYGNNQKNRQLGMWNNNVTNYMDCVSNCVDVKFIIPTGTAIQNARANDSLRQTTIYTSASPAPPTISEAESITSLNGIEQTYPFMDNVVNWRNKTDFTRDSIHADYGIGRYIAASTLFQKVLSKVLGLDIQDCTYRIPQTTGGNYREQLCTAVTNENISAIVDCVKSAILNPTSIQS